MDARHSIHAVLVISVFLVLCLPALAQESSKPEREGFRFGLELGVGSIERTLFDAELDETNFYAGFLGGYWIGEHILAGLELNGWLLQASNLRDPSVGEGISQVLLIAQIYPSTEYEWFIKAGGGYVSYWNNRPGEPTGDDGGAFQVGGGYDLVIKIRGNPWLITPFVTFSSGNIGDERYKAFTIGAGVSYEF